MAAYDWLKSPEFRGRVRQRLSEAAAKRGMKRLRSDVVTWLLSQVERNFNKIVQAELLRDESLRHREADALDSAEFLGQYGAEFAAAQNRNVLMKQDVQQLLQNPSADFWPFRA